MHWEFACTRMCKANTVHMCHDFANMLFATAAVPSAGIAYAYGSKPSWEALLRNLPVCLFGKL